MPTCSAPPDLAGESWDILGDEVFKCQDEDDDIITNNDVIGDDIGSLLFSDPDTEDPIQTVKNEEKSDSIKEFLVNVMTSIVSINSDSAVIKWILDDPDDKCKKLYIQYYEISKKEDTLLFAPVSSNHNSYTINHLTPQTRYKACVLPSLVKNEVPSSVSSPQQCVQFITESGKKDKSKKGSSNQERTATENPQWKMPDSETLTEYLKIIGFSFVVSVLITGVCVFIYEMLVLCCRLICGSDRRKPHQE